MMRKINYLLWIFKVSSVKPDKDYWYNGVKPEKYKVKNRCKP